MNLNEKTKKIVGISLCIIGAFFSIVVTYLLFIEWYEPLQVALLAGSGCDAIIVIFLPLVSDLGIIAGMLYIISALSFFSESKWAFQTAVIANICALQASFWSIIPAIPVGLPPVYLIVFLPNLLIYFSLLALVGDIPWNRIILGLLVGMAFVMSFMNGVASTNRILGTFSDPVRIASGGPVYVLSQRLNWVASLGFGIVTAGVILFPKKEWLKYVAIGAVLFEIIAGMPLAILNTLDQGNFSMFFAAPMLSILVLIICFWPNLWEIITYTENS